MMNTPVIVFAYNRPVHLKATIEALLRNVGAEETELYIYSDAASNENHVQAVAAVRSYSRTISGFKKIELIEREKNYGLGNNVISGVSEVLSRHEQVIVLEDDLITSPYFLQYMNNALELYALNEQVISVHGYVYPISRNLPDSFFLKGADCLGWATWHRGWAHFEKDGQKLLEEIETKGKQEIFDFGNAYPYTQMLRDQIEGRNSSWAVRWYASAFLKDLYTLYPGKSLVYHNGGDGTGTNAGQDMLLDVQLSDRPIKLKAIPVRQHEEAYAAFCEFLKKLNNPPLLYRLRRKFKKIIS